MNRKIIHYIFLKKWNFSHKWTSKGCRCFCLIKRRGFCLADGLVCCIKDTKRRQTKSFIWQQTIPAADCVIYLIGGSVDFRDLDIQIKHHTCRLIPMLQLLPFSSCSTSLYPRPCQTDSGGDYPVSSGREKRTCGNLSPYSLNSIALQGR